MPIGGRAGPSARTGRPARSGTPGIADAHVDDPAHVAGREEQQVVERYRRRVTDDVDPDLTVLGVRPGPDCGVDRLDLGQLLVEPPSAIASMMWKYWPVRPGR
jgi:hypothetical protein